MTNGHDIAQAALRNHRRLEELFTRRWAELPRTCPPLVAALCNAASMLTLIMEGDKYGKVVIAVEVTKKGRFRLFTEGLGSRPFPITEEEFNEFMIALH